ncbi:hypothetical protein FAJ40_08110 [Streptococcus suis]|nr:hypothetical protein FAJ40_08110 [Streptococcus suis]
MIRSDFECKTRINLPINHCAGMLTRTLRSGTVLFAPNLFVLINSPNTVERPHAKDNFSFNVFTGKCSYTTTI